MSSPGRAAHDMPPSSMMALADQPLRTVPFRPTPAFGLARAIGTGVATDEASGTASTRLTATTGALDVSGALEHALRQALMTAVMTRAAKFFITRYPPRVPGDCTGAGCAGAFGLKRYAVIGSVMRKRGIDPTPALLPGASVRSPTPSNFGNLLRSRRKRCRSLYVPSNSMFIGTCVKD